MLWILLLNTFRLTQNGCHFADNIFKWTLLNVNALFWFKFQWNSFAKGLDGNKRSLVQIMAWRRAGNNPLSEPVMALFTDAYVTRPWWVNTLKWLAIFLKISLILKNHNGEFESWVKEKCVLCIAGTVELHITHEYMSWQSNETWEKVDFKFRCSDFHLACLGYAGIILGIGSAKEKRRYNVTLFLIG